MRAAGKRLLFDQAQRVPAAHWRGRGVAGGCLPEQPQHTGRVLLVAPDRLIHQQVSACTAAAFAGAANLGVIGRVVVPANFVLAIEECTVIDDRLQRQDSARRAVAGHSERFGDARVVPRVDLEQCRLQRQRRVDVIAQLAPPMCGRVVAPATAAGHGQRMRTKACTDKVGEDRHAAEIGAHDHVTELGGQVGREQRALVTQLGQPRIFAPVDLLRGHAVANQVFGGAVAATIVEQYLHAPGIWGVEQFAQIKLSAQTYLLCIASTAFDTAMQVGNGFRGVVARQLDTLVFQPLTLPAPVTGECRLGHQVGSIGQCAGQWQKAKR
ncbi:hypothetical protein D3C79_633250 [compost metagenome]